MATRKKKQCIDKPSDRLGASPTRIEDPSEEKSANNGDAKTIINIRVHPKFMQHGNKDCNLFNAACRFTQLLYGKKITERINPEKLLIKENDLKNKRIRLQISRRMWEATGDQTNATPQLKAYLNRAMTYLKTHTTLDVDFEFF